LKLFKKIHWFELILITAVMGIHLYTAFSAAHNFPSRWFTRDDAYYYFKVAQNISEGYGSTFDGINLTNGYHPLWMLICVPIFSLARYDLILPLRIMILVMAVLSTITSILLFRLLKKHISEIAAIMAASFWAFSLEVHSIITQQGMETGIVALSIVAFLVVLQRFETKPELKIRDLVLLSLAALFVLFSRLDGIYLVLISGIWIIFRRNPIRYLLPLDILFTFSIVVLAFIQRATLKVYLLAFDSSAIFFGFIAILIQLIVFYFFGLYNRPANFSPAKIILLSLIGVTLSAMITSAIMVSISAIGILDIPRAVPILYWIGLLGTTIISRLLFHYASPWKLPANYDFQFFHGMVPWKKHLQVYFEPMKQWMTSGLVYFGIIAAGLGIYMATNWKIFGTIMPVSGQIKRWWGSLPNDVYGGGAKSVLDVFGIDPLFSESWGLFVNQIFDLAKRLSTLIFNIDFWYWFILFLIGSIYLVFFLLDRKRFLRRIYLLGLFPLFISAELHTFFYGGMAYAAKHEWYWVIQMLAIVIVSSLGIQGLIDLFSSRPIYQLFYKIVIGVFSLYLAYGYSVELISRMPYQDPLAGEPYMDTTPILEDFTEPGSLIGMTGGGNTGYYIHDRTIINMDGLINSYGYFLALKENQGGKYIENIGLDYIFANRYIITNSMPYRYQFDPENLITVENSPVYGQKELMRVIRP